jgi:hypothetical protein
MLWQSHILKFLKFPKRGKTHLSSSGEPLREADASSTSQDLQRLYHSIGRFIFAFSQLEFLIRHSLGEALKLDNNIFYAVTASYDFATLCRVMRNIYNTASACSEQEREEIGEVLKDCLKLNGERVRIVHGTWFINENELGTDHVSRQTLEPKTYYSGIEDIEKVVGQLNMLITRLIAFLTVTGVILRATTSEATMSPDAGDHGRFQ